MNMLALANSWANSFFIRLRVRWVAGHCWTFGGQDGRVLLPRGHGHGEVGRRWAEVQQTAGPRKSGVKRWDDNNHNNNNNNNNKKKPEASVDWSSWLKFHFESVALGFSWVKWLPALRFLTASDSRSRPQSMFGGLGCTSKVMKNKKRCCAMNPRDKPMANGNKNHGRYGSTQKKWRADDLVPTMDCCSILNGDADWEIDQEIRTISDGQQIGFHSVSKPWNADCLGCPAPSIRPHCLKQNVAKCLTYKTWQLW